MPAVTVSFKASTSGREGGKELQERDGVVPPIGGGGATAGVRSCTLSTSQLGPLDFKIIPFHPPMAPLGYGPKGNSIPTPTKQENTAHILTMKKL